MSLSRRDFIKVSGAALCAGALPLNSKASDLSESTLPIPPLLESRRGQPLFLTLQQAHWTFMKGQKTPVWGINGRYLGPTLRIKNNDDMKLVYTNRLAEPVSMTISGLQVPGSLMGGAGRLLAPGHDWSPVLPIRQAGCTCWYHANTPGRMAPHIYQGLAGMLLIDDPATRNTLLPTHYGVDDIPLILQDKRFNGFGDPQYTPPEKGGFIGDTLLVNGVTNPSLQVSRGWVRLRLLNASNARRYQLQLSDGRPMMVIAGDLGLLPAPVAVQQLSLAPGERREILIDMSKGEEVSITAGEPAGIMERLRGLFEPSTMLVSTLVLTLKPTGLLPLVTSAIPTSLLTEPLPQANPVRSREFRLGDNEPGINGALWDMKRVDTQVQQGSWERWVIRADRPQSFHIQGSAFLIRTINNAPAMGEDRGWKDTVWVDGEVELLVYFNQSSSADFPFLYYSQTLEMADRGSTAQLLTVPKPY